MDTLSGKSCDPLQLSSLALAFVGDTVYDLLVRESLVTDANRPVNALHKLAVEQVKASAQAQAIKDILPLLTEEEAAVFKRARNTRTNHLPKNSNPADYHYATGLEALFGYLYLKCETERIREIFRLINDR